MSKLWIANKLVKWDNWRFEKIKLITIKKFILKIAINNWIEHNN